MRYELYFGYDGEGDNWLKAESDSLSEIAAEFFGFIEQTSCEKYARLYVWDNDADGVCAPFYTDLHPGCNERSELPQKLLAWRAKQWQA